MIIQEFDFEYNPTLQEPSARYPKLKNGAFVMSLQTKTEFLIAEVTYNQVFKDIDIQILDSKSDLIQIRIRASSGQNLLFLEGYYLYWLEEQNKFVFGSYDENL